MTAALAAARDLETQGLIAEATEILRHAAAAGDGISLAALAKHLLIHRPDLAREGLAAATAAAKAGNGEAAHLLAVFIAAGIGFRADWQVALNALLHSAELGWAPAQRELELLAGQQSNATNDWRRLRDRIDVPFWLISPSARQLSASPRIFSIGNFTSPLICDWLIELARPHLKPAMTYDPAVGGTHYETGRTNSASHIILPYSDLVLAFIRARLAAITRVPVNCLEITTFLHYLPGQAFEPHHDYLDDSFPGYTREIAKNGQRVLTFLLYLNDDFQGGETDFPLIGLRHKAGKGDALFFWNVQPDRALDRQTLHAGLPPSSGEKWLLSQWVRNKPA
jgi:prolyl 4-hydroxylase